jgi:hypothetical protein
MANRKGTNNDLQNIAQKTIEQQEHTKNRGEVGFSGRVSSSYSTFGIRRVILVTNPVIRHVCRTDGL